MFLMTIGGAQARHRVGCFALALAALVAACNEPPAPPAPVRPVRTIVIDPEQTTNTYSAAGEIKARYETPLAFRLSGHMIRRDIDVGTVVKASDPIAALDDRDARNAVDAAEADVFAAQSALTQLRTQEGRMRQLLRNDYTPQAKYDEALRNMRAGEAKLQSANASLRSAQDQLSYTILTAPRDGVITAVGADAGQVVGAGQMVAQLADPSEREAVFHVPGSLLRGSPRKDRVVKVSLLDDATITTEGQVREVSPTADPVTRTYAVRISLPNAPPAMSLGASVRGQVTEQQQGAVAVVPATALFEKDGQPAVWIVDPTTSAVQLRSVTVDHYEADAIVITTGLSKGDVVVTAGVQKLSPGQKVRLTSGS
jgi:membrane fusion protein, multidrug efflux system